MHLQKLLPLLTVLLCIRPAQCRKSRHSINAKESTTACAEDFDLRNSCEDFNRCCTNLCSTVGGFESECSIKGSEATMRCLCTTDNDDSSSDHHEINVGYDTTTAVPYQHWRPPTRTTRSRQVTTTSPPAHSGHNHPEIPSGSQRCGTPSVEPLARIVGGEEAAPHSWPWQVSLQLKGRHLCGGSLIDSNNVLTAAHCFMLSKVARNFRVVAGMHDRSSALDDDQSFAVDVAQITIHPDYDDQSNSHDAAVVRLARPVTFSSHVSPVCLPQSDVAASTDCMATGWGDTLGTGNNRVLLQVRIPIVSRSTCNSASNYRGRIDDTMICAGTRGKDSCQGDSGGPLVCQKSDKSWELQGITSWGAECGSSRPGVYTRVTNVMDWVKRMQKS